MKRPSLLLLTALAAGAAGLANGVGAVQRAQPVPTRLGVALAGDVAAVDTAVRQRQRGLDLREAAARAAEARLAAELAQRENASRKQDADAGEQYDSLARIYQAMKPARAAVVFEQLEMDVQMQVARRIRERQMGQILAGMSPAGAAALSMALARKDPAIRPPAKVAAAAATPPSAAPSATPPVSPAAPSPSAPARG